MCEVWITALATQYPEFLLRPKDIERFASAHFEIGSLGLQRLFKINRTTGIETRSSISQYEYGFATGDQVPTIAELNAHNLREGTDLTVQACLKAVKEWGGSLDSLTHAIGTTCTIAGCPGFDVAVANRLGLEAQVETTLLGGVGCAGGGALLRLAAQIAASATAFGRPARILAFACEICTPSLRRELEHANASAPDGINISTTLFSDAASAFIMCNELGITEKQRRLFRVVGWKRSLLPGTSDTLSYMPQSDGYQVVLGQEVPVLVKQATPAIFNDLVQSMAGALSPKAMLQEDDTMAFEPTDFDWAVHPGGKAVLQVVEEAMGLTSVHLHDSREIYRTYGNSSSPTVLIVLDRMRTGRRNVMAVAFGPGFCVEMMWLRRCD